MRPAPKRPVLLRGSAFGSLRSFALATVLVVSLFTTGFFFFFFFVTPTSGRIFDRKHNRESDTVNTVMAEMMGRSRDEVVKSWGPPAAVLDGENGGKLMVYLPPGRAAESDSPQISRTFFLDSRGFVYRWARLRRLRRVLGRLGGSAAAGDGGRGETDPARSSSSESGI